MKLDDLSEDVVLRSLREGAIELRDVAYKDTPLDIKFLRGEQLREIFDVVSEDSIRSFIHHQCESYIAVKEQRLKSLGVSIENSEDKP
jgi:hypothetical protein